MRTRQTNLKESLTPARCVEAMDERTVEGLDGLEVFQIAVDPNDLPAGELIHRG